MKILYKNQCLNSFPSTKSNFCEGCYFAYRYNCYAPVILTQICVNMDKIFKQETKKDIFYES